MPNSVRATRGHPGPDLFDGRDVTQLVARGGLGLVLIAIGWYQASDRLLLDDQTPWLSLAAGGLVLGCVSGALWIMQLRRAVSLRVADLRRETALVLAVEAQSHAPEEDVSEDLVAPAVGGARFFHRAECVLVSGHDTVTATEEEHRGAGRVACETCIVPEQPVPAVADDATPTTPTDRNAIDHRERVDG